MRTPGEKGGLAREATLHLLRLAALLSIALLPAGSLLAQEGGRIRGDPSNAKPDPCALGPLGGEGIRIAGAAALKAGVRPPAAGLEITDLRPRGAGAKAGLRRGDVIVGVGKRSLTAKDDPFLRLAELLEAPRKAGVPAVVRVRREGKAVKVPVLIPGTTKHPKTCPDECGRCGAILALALERLVEFQAEDGSFPTQLGGTNGQVAVSSIAGLAFLAAGSTPKEGPHAESLRSVRKWLEQYTGREREGAGNSGGRNWSQVNWNLGYGTLFLARAQALDPTEEGREKLEALRDALLENMEESGGWAHGPSNEFSYPLDYAELTAAGNICLAALGSLACRALGKRDWTAFMNEFRLEFLSLHNGDGTFGVRPADTSRFGMPNTDRTMGPAWRTATFAMILGLGGGRLDKAAGE